MPRIVAFSVRARRGCAAVALVLTALSGLSACAWSDSASAPSVKPSPVPASGASGSDRTTVPDNGAQVQDRDDRHDSDGSGARQDLSTGELDPLEWGNCTAEEITEAEESIDLTDLDALTSRAVAEAEVNGTLAGSGRTVIGADQYLTSTTLRVTAGASEIVIDPQVQDMVIIIEGHPTGLTVSGLGNTVWVDAVDQITFTADDRTSLNSVYWRDHPPSSASDPNETNLVGKDEHAPVIDYCGPFSGF